MPPGNFSPAADEIAPTTMALWGVRRGCLASLQSRDENGALAFGVCRLQRRFPQRMIEAHNPPVSDAWWAESGDKSPHSKRFAGSSAL
jgi:hypothetical protein